jgi:activator of HSP90 ATPase
MKGRIMASIHQEVSFKAAPGRVFDAIMDSKEHAEFTGAPAEISKDEGGEFSAYGGQVYGRNISVVPGTRIVQAWRALNWPEGVYSVAHFELTGEDGGTKLTFDQEGVPDSELVHIDPGWKQMYWDKLDGYLK